MLSRVANSLYWMSRYMERSDGILRMLKVNYASSQDDMQEFSWNPVLNLFTYLEEAEIHEIAKSTRSVLQYMITDKNNPNSVMNIVTQARENARSVQDHITKELWQCLNDFYHTMKEERLMEWLKKDDPITILDGLIKNGVLYYGTADITMSRGEGYSFMNIGKFLERAFQSADILNVKFIDRNYDVSTGTDATYWKYLLLSISGYELYFKEYRSGFEAKNVVELVVLNTNFPRSIIYSMNRLHRYFEQLKRSGNVSSYSKPDFILGRLLSKVRYSTPEMIMQQNLHSYLVEIKDGLYSIANALNENYFAYS